MKQTIVALYNISTNKDNIKINEISNKQLIDLCKIDGELLTLAEFSSRFNLEELNFNKIFIRFIEAELEIKACN